MDKLMEKFGIDEKEFESKQGSGDKKYFKAKDKETFGVSFKKLPETKGGILFGMKDVHKFVNGTVYIDPETKEKVVTGKSPCITLGIDLCGKVDQTTDKVTLEPVDMIWEITNKKVIKQIFNIAKEDESGESMLFSWIFKISRSGQNIDTTYTIIPSKPKKKIMQQQLEGQGVKVKEEKIPYV